MSSELLAPPISCPPDWPLVRLHEIARKIGSGATPTGGQAAYQPLRTGFAFIRSQNVFDRAFSDAGLAFISEAQAHGLRGVQLEPHDLLLNITGDGVTFGRACMVPGEVLPACVNQHVSIIRLDPKRADPGFVLSYLTHPAIKEYIEAFNAGGSRRAITKAHIESFVVPLPPLTVQRAISQVLGLLDDHIALLRETNATLEAIPQALFKSWFVDFDPVRAKQQGLVPAGMDEAAAALFPDSFEEGPSSFRVEAHTENRRSS
jgi:type I restriction enzyme S subunit